MSTTAQASPVDSNAIFHELSPKLIWLVRIVNIITLLMVIIAVIISVVRGSQVNPSYYLLVCNLVISGLVCLVVNWWYKRGDLGSEKFWFIILVGAVIFLQCITTDLFVFKEEAPQHPTTTMATTGITPNTTHLISWMTNLSPSSKRFIR